MSDDTDKQTGRRRVLREGRVESAKMKKTIVVSVERMTRHPLYGKTVRRTSKLYAHDEENQAKAGDVVEIEFCRPLSKLKRWRLVRVLKSGPAPVGTGEELGLGEDSGRGGAP